MGHPCHFIIEVLLGLASASGRLIEYPRKRTKLCDVLRVLEASEGVVTIIGLEDHAYVSFGDLDNKIGWAWLSH